MASTELLRKQLAERVGSDTDDVCMDDALTMSGGDVVLAALSILRTRLADMLAAPAVWSVQGDYSEDRRANLDHLRSQIVGLEAEAASGTRTVTTGQLSRSLPLR